MLEELTALAELSKMDESARHIETELEQMPARLEELRSSVAALESLLAQERAQLNAAETLRGQQTIELQERNEGLAKARKKVAQSSNMREAQASEREVEANRRAIKEREDELRRIGEAIEAKTGSLAEREKDFGEAKEMLRAEEQAAEAKLAELKVERDALLAGRSALVSKVSPMIIKRYDRLRKAMPNAVVMITDGNCPACRMSLPPQLFIELQRGTEIQDCPHCRRLVLYKGHVAAVVDDDGEPAESAESASESA